MDARRFLALSLLLASSAAVLAAVEDDYLFRAYVPGGRVVTLLPAKVPDDPSSLVWEDGRDGRLPHWRSLVARTLSGTEAAARGALRERDVDTAESGAGVRVRLDRVGESFAAAGILSGTAVRGVEVLSLAERVVTNAFSFAAGNEAGYGSVRLSGEPGRRSRVLLPERCVGQNVWLYDWDALRSRWEGFCRTAEGRARVRRELFQLEDSGRYGLPGGGAWKRRVSAWLRDGRRAALWPKVVFENGDPGAVEVSFGGKRETLRPGEAWTNAFSRLPDAMALHWEFRPTGESRDDYAFAGPGFSVEWSETARADAIVRIHRNLLVKKPWPRLFFDPKLVRHPLLRSEIAKPEALLVSVKYRDGEKLVLPVEPARDSGWASVEIEPHRPVENFTVEAGTLWRECVLVPEKPAWGRGETVSCRGRIEFKPWPEISIGCGAPDRSVTNVVSIVSDGGAGRDVLAGLFYDPVVAEPGSPPWKPGFDVDREMTLELERGNLQRAGCVLRIVSSAAYADTVTNEYPFVPGGDAIAVAPKPVLHDIPPPPEPEKLPWPDKYARLKPVLRTFAEINGQYSFSNKTPRQIADDVRKKIGDDAAVADIAKHLSLCTVPDCPDCTPFRELADKAGVPLPRNGEPADADVVFAALYEEYLGRNEGKRAQSKTATDVFNLLQGNP